MGKKIDLTGQKFEKLLVIKETDKRDSSGCIIWECQCDCGNQTYATSSDLRRGHKRSCGCLGKEQIINLGQKNYKDITNQRFGKLIAIEKTDLRKDGKVYWKCKCDCGNYCTASGKSLRNGNIQSCGCLKSVGEQRISKLLFQHNIPFEREKIFSDFKPYRYDFYINNCYVIEYDGKQHFQDYSWGSERHSLQESQNRDILKNSYCYKNNIPIIRIPYTHLSKLSIKDLLLETTNFLLKGDKENL